MTTLRFLPEHAAAAALILELVEREAEYLTYTHTRLFLQPITRDWIQNLADRPEDAERIDAFVARFSRLQDTLGEKLLPQLATLLGENPKTLLDVLAYAERQGWIENSERFVAMRRLRNRLVHEYLTDEGLFLEALLLSETATRELLGIVKRLREQIDTLGIKRPA